MPFCRVEPSDGRNSQWTSTKDMTHKQLQHVFDAMKMLGFKVKTAKPNKITTTDAQSKKIRALLSR
ncbi:MAG: phage protein GemA/Gp16 family protein [Candidatus Malihini olakiniferum]